MERAVVYARVLVRDEDVGNQVKSVEEWVRAHSYEVIGVFKDESLSRLIRL